jgi:hypothetical protein
VAEDFHDHSGWHTWNQEHCRAGVPQIVEADRGQAALPDDLTKVTKKTSRLERSSEGGGEDQTLLVPMHASGSPL